MTRLAIARPMVVWMTLAAIAVLGIIAYFRLPAELNPQVPIPTLTVVTPFPGAGPAEVEREVSKPLENAAAGITGVQNVYSSSQSDVSILSMDLQVGTNLRQAQQELQRRIDAVRNSLPAGVETPRIAPLDINAQPVLTLGFTGQSPQQLRELISRQIAPHLQRLPGVGSMTTLGGSKQEIAVQVRPSALARNGLTLSDVINSLQAAGQNIPGGTLSGGAADTEVRLNGAYTSLNQVRSTPLLSSSMAGMAQFALQQPGSAPSLPEPPLTVADVAQVKRTWQTASALVRINNVPGISLIFTKADGASAVTVVQNLLHTLHQLGAHLPAGVKAVVLRDDSHTVQAALNDVDLSLILGAFLAMAVVLLFLHNMRGTLIVSLALPSCVLATFGVMYLAHFTLNQMTLLALSLSVGILIDDSIVVLESITRHLHMGESPRRAALNGRAEIGFSGIAITLVDVVVFVPIAFMGGIVGGFFKQFGLCIVTATLFSLLVSFTVTPMLASRWYRRGEKLEPAGGIFARLENIICGLEQNYRHAIRYALTHRALVLTAAAALLGALLIFSASHLGFEFIPGIDQGQVVVNIEMPPGSSLKNTDAAARSVEEQVRKLPQVQYTVATVGQLLGGFGTIPRNGAQYAQIGVRLKPKQNLLQRLFGTGGSQTRSASDEQVAQTLRRMLAVATVQTGARITTAAVRSVIGLSAPIDIELRGPNTNALIVYASKVQAVLARRQDVLDPDVSVRSGQPRLSVRVNPSRAAAFHLAPALVGQALRIAVHGEQAGSLQQGDHSLPIRVMLINAHSQSPQQLGGLPVGTDSGGQPVLLNDVAALQLENSPSSLERSDGERLITVTADLAPGAHLGNVERSVNRQMLAIPHPNIRIHWSGDAEALNDNIIPFVTALGIAVMLVYLVTASLFNSLGTPLVILFTLPMALAGAFAALALTGETLSLVAAIGIIMLSGLMGRNAILLLDYTNQLRRRNHNRSAALEEAGATRLRPILMTSMATILGMLPVAMKIGEASEIRAPMATVVIGGLLVSTILTLIVIPVLYTLLEDLAQRFLPSSRRASYDAENN